MTTIVLVHGAFHGGWCWEPLLPELAARRVDAVTVDLPLTSLDEDAAAVTAVLDAVDGPVTLLGHSYGGAPITVAGPPPGRRAPRLPHGHGARRRAERHRHRRADRRRVHERLPVGGQRAARGRPGPRPADLLPRRRPGRRHGLRARGCGPATPVAPTWSAGRRGTSGRATTWSAPTTPSCSPTRSGPSPSASAPPCTRSPGDHSPFLSRPAELADLLAPIADG